VKDLLNIISELRHEDDAPSKLFHSMSQRLRNLYGECAIVVMTSSDSQFEKVSVSLFYDHIGHVCIEEQDVSQKKCNKSFHGDFLKKFLNGVEPVKYIGKEFGIDPIFNDFFIHYIDAITFPVFHQGNDKRWLIILFPGSEQLEKVDIERTLLLSTLVINYIESIQDSKKLQQANVWIEGELKSVANIKQQLLPQSELTFSELNIAVMYEPYAMSGGDYYDIARLTDFLNPITLSPSNEIFGIIIADASGHGAASAVEISMFDAILRTYKPSVDEGPAGVFNYANKYLFTRLIRNGFITAFVSSYQTENHVLSYANAGHPPPIIKRASNNSIEILSNEVGIPLGIDQGNHWTSSEIIINKNDILVVYTDGVTELRSSEGVLFGEDALINIIKESDNSPEIMLKNIKSKIRLHQGTNSNSDDLTLLIIQPNL